MKGKLRTQAVIFWNMIEVVLLQWTHQVRKAQIWSLSVVVYPHQVICPMSEAPIWRSFLTAEGWMNGIPCEQHLDHTLSGHTSSWPELKENASGPEMTGEGQESKYAPLQFNREGPLTWLFIQLCFSNQSWPPTARCWSFQGLTGRILWSSSLL